MNILKGIPTSVLKHLYYSVGYLFHCNSMFNNKNLLLCAKPSAIMFRLKYNSSLDTTIFIDFSYTYTDPSTKQTVTKTANSTDSEYTFPCAVGDTVTFSNLTNTIFIPNFGPELRFTCFNNGVDVSPSELHSPYSKFSVTVSGESPYIEYFFRYGGSGGGGSN